MKPILYQLGTLADKGDIQAIKDLRDLANDAAYLLTLLTDFPVGHPGIPESQREGVAAAHEVAKHSRRWPVALNAVKEMREEDLRRFQKLEVGSLLGIRLNGKGRGFDYNQQTGFADDIFQDLEAIRLNPTLHLHPADVHPELDAEGVLTPEQSKRDWKNLAALLPPISNRSLDEWVEAGLQMCRENCNGDWHNFPWPECVKGKAGKDTDGNGSLRNAESAVRGKIRDGLKTLI